MLNTNSHIFYVRYLSVTDHRGSRVKITCCDVSEKPASITLPYDYSQCDSVNQAQATLEKAGFKLIAMNCRGKDDILVAEWDADRVKEIFGLAD